MTPRRAFISFLDMSNVLNEEKKQQVIALGRLGWSVGASSDSPVYVAKPQVLI